MKCILNIYLFLLLTLAGATAQNNSPAPPPPPHMMEHFHMGMGPMGDWWKNSDIAQKLNLTDPQKQQLQQIFSSHRATFISLRGDLENEEGKLKDLVDQEQPQDDQVLAQVDQVSAARAKLDREFATVALAFRKILTAGQWKQLQTLTMHNMVYIERHDVGKPGAPPQ